MTEVTELSDLQNLAQELGTKDRATDRLWMVGQPGVGKTHMAQWLGQRSMALTLHVGQELRERYGEEYFINHLHSAAAPTELDEEVESMINRAVMTAADQDTMLIIDSLKHARQVSNIPREGGDMVLFITTSPKITRERMRKESPSRRKLWAKANEEWKVHCPNLIKALEDAGIPIRYIDNDVTR